jgi:asparagine synthase (glutamine-hydrolysing)
MCGIGGVLAREGGAPPAEATLARMLRTLVHRGPDDEGRHVDGRIAFGARRLSVIDVLGSHQPLANEDETVWAVLNGEIYNYRELRAELEGKGHRFRTEGDTETIVHLYEEHGLDFPTRLNGMFAIALWDARRGRLALVRDRVGIKPLYYYADGSSLVFGSEIKALLASERVPREIDEAAARDYALLLYVPGPHSIFRGVRKLSPGHLLVCEGERLEVARYWRLPSAPLNREPLDAQVQRFRELFRDAVSLQLRSDVPFGAFLSGGVDSSAVVGTMSRLGVRVKTFSIGYEKSARYDERPHARAVAQLFDTEHQEFVVDPGLFHLLPEVAEFYDEPFADAAALPTYVLSGLTRQKVKVVLTGDGGDELFAGYDRYRSELLAEMVGRIPRAVRRGVFRRLLDLYRGPADWRVSDWVRLARKKLVLGELPADERYVRHFFNFDHEEFARVLGERLRDEPDAGVMRSYRAIMAEAEGADFLGRRTHLDVRTWLPDQMLTKVDRATMAHGLEARVPFLDHRLVEFAATLPQGSKLLLWRLKRFLKVAFADLLPRSILHRRKHGFEVPIDEWLRGPQRDFARDVLSPAALSSHGLFDAKEVQRLLAEHLERRRNRSRELFGLIVFQLWYDRWMRAPAAALRAGGSTS